MGLFSDVFSGLGDVVSGVTDFFTGGDSGGTLSSMSPDNVDPLSLDTNGGGGGPLDPGVVDPSSGGAGGGPGIGGAAKLAAAAGSALAGSGSKTNLTIPTVSGPSKFLQNSYNTRANPGKANKAPTADPNQIYAQWQNRLGYFVGQK